MDQKAQKALLESYLRQLKLPTFLQNYQAFAQDALRSNQSLERYLFGLCEAEVLQKEANRVERCIANAKFPVIKEVDSFDFSVVGGISKVRVANERSNLESDGDDRVEFNHVEDSGNSRFWQLRDCNGSRWET